MAYKHTLTNLIAATRQIIAEPTANFWSDTILTSYINDGIKMVAELSGCMRFDEIVFTIPNVREVMYSNQYKVVAVELLVSPRIALMRITPQQAGHVPCDGMYPQYWFEYGGQLNIEPISSRSCPLLLYTTAPPATIALATEIPDIPYPFRGLLPFYAAARAFNEDNKLSQSQYMMSIFLNDVRYLAATILPNVPTGMNEVRVY
jgi:hypothetical protein